MPIHVPILEPQYLYSLVDMYALCSYARAFDPSFAKDHVNAAFVDGMSAIAPLNALGMLVRLKQQLPQYLSAAANAPAFNKGSVADYSNAILDWWRTNGTSLLLPRVGAGGARRLRHFAYGCNSRHPASASSPLLKNLFGDAAMSALALTTCPPSRANAQLQPAPSGLRSRLPLVMLRLCAACVVYVACWGPYCNFDELAPQN